MKTLTISSKKFWLTALQILSTFALLLVLTACATPAERAAQDACDCMTPLHEVQSKAEAKGEAVDQDELFQIRIEMSTCFVKLAQEYPEMEGESEGKFNEEVTKHMREICPDIAK